jgi:ABC-2 type transport system permease protein
MTAAVMAEVAKLPAFVRRDVKVALSYRVAFASDVIGLAAQIVVFSFIAKLVDPSRLPTFGGTQVTYLEFVATGLVLNLMLGVLLYRVAGAIRQEQLQGTLESLMATPTATATVQIGSVASTLLMVPLRATLMMGAIAIVFGLSFDPAGIAPAALVMTALVPFAWGLGLATGAAIVTFRRGSGMLGAGTALLGLASGAVFPLALLPDWLASIAEWNPLAIAIQGVREALLGGAGWSEALADVALLIPLSALTLAGGILLFRLALDRERRRGTLGMY